jgi:hypothetical protein
MIFDKVLDPDPNPQPRVPDPDLAKCFGSTRIHIRIHNTGLVRGGALLNSLLLNSDVYVPKLGLRALDSSRWFYFITVNLIVECLHIYNRKKTIEKLSEIRLYQTHRKVTLSVKKTFKIFVPEFIYSFRKLATCSQLVSRLQSKKKPI